MHTDGSGVRFDDGPYINLFFMYCFDQFCCLNDRGLTNVVLLQRFCGVLEVSQHVAFIELSNSAFTLFCQISMTLLVDLTE